MQGDLKYCAVCNRIRIPPALFWFVYEGEDLCAPCGYWLYDQFGIDAEQLT